jgi:hypothetical protein
LRQTSANRCFEFPSRKKALFGKLITRYSSGELMLLPGCIELVCFLIRQMEIESVGFLSASSLVGLPLLFPFFFVLASLVANFLVVAIIGKGFFSNESDPRLLVDFVERSGLNVLTKPG